MGSRSGNDHDILAISVGPGDAAYVTEMARRRAASCDLLIGSADQLAAIGPGAGQEAVEAWGVDRILDLVERCRGRRIGVLITGDAGIYSLVSRFRDRFGPDAVREIVPGVSSLQVAFARIGETWLDVRAFNYRERAIERLPEVLEPERAAIFCDRAHPAALVLRRILPLGLLDGRRRVWVCQNLTLDDEQVTEIRSPSDISVLETRRFELIVMIKAGADDR